MKVVVRSSSLLFFFINVFLGFRSTKGRSPERLLVDLLQRLCGSHARCRRVDFGGERLVVGGGFADSHFAVLGLQIDDGAAGGATDRSSVAVAFGMERRAEIGVGVAAGSDAGEVEFCGRRKRHFDVAEVGMDVHFRDGQLAGAQFDVAALDRDFERVGEVADMDVAGTRGQTDGPDEIRRGEIAERHAHLAGKFLDVQVGLLAVEAQRLRDVPELDDAGIGACDGHLAVDILQFDVGSVPLRSTGPFTLTARMMSLRRRCRPSLRRRCSGGGRRHYRRRFRRCPLTSRDVEIAVRPWASIVAPLGTVISISAVTRMVAGDVILIRSDGNFVAVARDFEGRILVGAVGSALFHAADRFVAGDFHQVASRAGDARVSAEAFNDHARRFRGGFLCGDGVTRSSRRTCRCRPL